MTQTPLSQKRCLPCEGIYVPLPPEEQQALLREIPEWRLEAARLKRTLRFHNFARLMEFVNAMAALAESEGHHPNFYVRYNLLDIEIWTHAVDTLTENDFILAAKIDELWSQRKAK